MDFEATLEDLARTIEGAQTQTGQSQMVDLKSIEGQVQDFCAQIQSLDPETAHSLKPKVVALISGLEVLERDLKTFMAQGGEQDHG